MPALAFSNNDVAVVAWTFDKHLDGCLGFAVIQIDSSGKETPLPAMATFDGKPPGPNNTTEQSPVRAARRARSSRSPASPCSSATP